MIETFAPHDDCDEGWVVVRSYPWADRAYAQANPDWLREGLITRRVTYESMTVQLSDEIAARWFDTIDDATVFVKESDAAALALIIDGRVLRVQDADETQAGWSH